MRAWSKLVLCWAWTACLAGYSEAQTPVDSTRRDTLRPARIRAEALLLTGYTHTDVVRGRWLTLGPLLPNLIQFNTVEGWVLSESLDFNRRLDKKRRFLTLGGAARYGFAGKNLYARGYVSWLFNRTRGQLVRVEGGRYVQQFNADEPIVALTNTAATLLRGVNFMKPYERRFVTFRYEQKLGKTLTLIPSLELARRVALGNTSLISLRKEKARRFTSNDPQQPEGNGLNFQPHDLILTGLDAQLDWGATFNRLTISVRQALPDDAVGASFAKVNLHYLANWSARSGVGESRLSASTGTFLWKNRAYFPDYWHFFGNETRSLRTQPEAFSLLPYYTHSTSRWFAQGFYERHFQGQFFGKNPLLKALGWHELVGARVLLTPERRLYAEAIVGVENILRLYRLDVIAAFGNPHGARLAVRYGVGF